MKSEEYSPYICTHTKSYSLYIHKYIYLCVGMRGESERKKKERGEEKKWNIMAIKSFRQFSSCIIYNIYLYRNICTLYSVYWANRVPSVESDRTLASFPLPLNSQLNSTPRPILVMIINERYEEYKYESISSCCFLSLRACNVLFGSSFLILSSL